MRHVLGVIVDSCPSINQKYGTSVDCYELIRRYPYLEKPIMDAHALQEYKSIRKLGEYDLES